MTKALVSVSVLRAALSLLHQQYLQTQTCADIYYLYYFITLFMKSNICKMVFYMRNQADSFQPM